MCVKSRHLFDHTYRIANLYNECTDNYSGLKTIEGMMMFKSKIFLMSFVAVLGSTLIGLMLSNSSNAANPEPVVVDVTFVAPIQITATNSLDFGLLDENLVDPEFILIAPDSSVTDLSGRVVGVAPIAANLTITGAPGRSIQISVATSGVSVGYTLGSYTCDYTGGALGVQPCGGGGYTDTSGVGPNALFVGVTLTGVVGGAVGVGLDPNEFEVTITYN
jgi:hypothetical protein